MSEQELRTTISYSELTSFTSCEKKHEYSYLRNLESVKRSDALSNGTATHNILEDYYRAQQAHQQHGTWTEETQQEEYVKALTRVTEVDAKTGPALAIALRKAPFKDWTILAVEKQLGLVLPNGITFNFVIDLVVKDLFGKVWVIDHKTTKDFYSSYMLNLNPQLPRYVGAARALGLPIDKAGYSLIRTGYAKDAVEEQMYQFVEIDVNNDRVNQSFKEQMYGAYRIQQVRQDFAEGRYEALRNVDTFGCKMCPFKDLCAAEMVNKDVEATLAFNYQPKTRRA